MASITQLVEQRLKLRVNREKSAVARGRAAPLGFQFFAIGTAGSRCRVIPKASSAPRSACQLTARNWGVSMERRIEEINRFTVGWTAYFAFADTPYPFERLDQWLRRRLRQVRWKEWKRVRTKRRKLIAHGIPADEAHNAPAPAEDPGATRAPGSSTRPCPRPTGPTSACKGSPAHTAVSGMRREPPGADPHAGWWGAPGELGAYRTRGMISSSGVQVPCGGDDTNHKSMATASS